MLSNCKILQLSTLWLKKPIRSYSCLILQFDIWHLSDLTANRNSILVWIKNTSESSKHPPGKRRHWKSQHCWWRLLLQNHFLHTWNTLQSPISILLFCNIVHFSSPDYPQLGSPMWSAGVQIMIYNSIYLATPDRTPMCPPGIWGAAW